jgi:hypothetical protein
MAFMRAMLKLNKAGKRIDDFLEIKEFLNIAGFSQNGRNRILHLSSEEFSELCKSCPADEKLWSFYVNELQTLLSKMDQVRNTDSFLGRPYVTAELAGTIGKLARLKHLDEQGLSSLPTFKVRELLLNDYRCKSLAQQNTIEQSGNQQDSESIKIQSTIKLMELYRDELIMPPRLRTRQNYYEFDSLYDLESGIYYWMDDGGVSYLEAIRDIPLFTQYDELPHFEAVLDWFIATKPVLDKNQTKQGWNWLEKSSEEWHQLDELYGLSEEQINEYPSWCCALTERIQLRLSVIPPGNPYRVLPLTTPRQLLEESKMMHHCVVTYLDDCIRGYVRIFSVRICSNNARVATVELANRTGQWRITQLKGKYNQELIDRVEKTEDPLAILLDALVKWYNGIA